MSYDVLPSGFREEYIWVDATFGATTVNHNIIGPKGCYGFVRDIFVDLTTSLDQTNNTTPAEIDIGLSNGDFTFGRYRLATAIGGATTGYKVGAHRAGAELITGLPPRALNDFAGHVVLDGGPLGTIVTTPGGSSSTVAPLGRIPAGGYTITNIVSGTGTADRIFVLQPLDTFLAVGQTIYIQGAGGTNLAVNGSTATITALNATQGWIECNTGAFTGTYTSGGFVDVVAVVTNKASTGGTPAGGGLVKVYIDWLGNTW